MNVRLLAATNKDLTAEIKANRFREDLFHRLSVIIIKVPSLQERLEDIPVLTEKFLADIAEEYGNKPKEIAKEAMELLQQRAWTGNIRELRNVIERLIIMSDATITPNDVQKFA